MHATPGNIAGNGFLKVLTALSSHCCECVKVKKKWWIISLVSGKHSFTLDFDIHSLLSL
jgi:hypothetical protein